MDLKKLGRAVRALRVRRGWRQEDLGRAVGVSRSVVWRVERGRRQGITIDTLDALAAALDASIDLVMRGRARAWTASSTRGTRVWWTRWCGG